MNEVTVELITQAVRLGMIKKSAKVYHVYRHRHYDIKVFYNRLVASK